MPLLGVQRVVCREAQEEFMKPLRLPSDDDGAWWGEGEYERDDTRFP